MQFIASSKSHVMKANYIVYQKIFNNTHRRVFNISTLLRKLLYKWDKPLNIPKLTLIICWCTHIPLFYYYFLFSFLFFSLFPPFFQFRSPNYSILKIYIFIHHFYILDCWLIPWINLCVKSIIYRIGILW